MAPDILGIGEVVVDWVATVDHFPEPDEKIDSKSQNLFSGGVTANYTVAISRLGGSVGFFGAIGDDEHGHFLLNDFRGENVDVQHLIIKKGEKTPVNFIFVVESTGEKVIIQSPYMHTTIPSVADFSYDWLNGVKLIHTTGIYPEVAEKVFKLAKQKNILISFDLEKQIATWGSQKLLPMLKYVDILLPNKFGAIQLTNTDNIEEAAQKFLELGIETIIITKGDKGATAFTLNEKIDVPAIKIKPIDTTGAGDTFCAAFTYYHGIKKKSIQDSLQIANIAAGLKTLKLGARTGMPNQDMIRDYIKKTNIELQKEF